MIRTKVVRLTCKEAVAYREKLKDGGSSVVVVCKGDQVATAAISKTSREAIPAKNAPKDFPIEAFNEAIELTMSMPYRKLGKVKYEEVALEEVKDVVEVIVDSKDYNQIVDHYTNKKDQLSYELINKDLIQFATSSTVVKTMIEEKQAVEAILNYCVGVRFRTITNNPDLTDEQVQKISEMLDEVSPKGVYKEFEKEIRKMLG